MFNLLKIEFYKLKKSKIFYFFLFLTILQAIIIYIFSIKDFSKNLKLMNGKETLVYMFFIQSTLTVNMLIGVFASDYIVTEFTSGYIKNLISYGHRRISIFISKTMAYYIAGIILAFTVPVVMFLINTARNGYGEAFTFNSLVVLIRLFFIMSLIYIAIGSISALIAFASRNVNITMGIVIALDFINRIFNIMVIRKPSFRWIFDKLIFSQTSIVLQDKAVAVDFLQAGVISLITILVNTAAGIYIFKKEDIK